jgi:hypothetical protein
MKAKTIWASVRRRLLRSAARRLFRHRSFWGPRWRRFFESVGIGIPLRDEEQEIRAGYVPTLAASVDLQAAAARGPKCMATPAQPGGGFIEAIKSIRENRPRN